MAIAPLSPGRLIYQSGFVAAGAGSGSRGFVWGTFQSDDNTAAGIATLISAATTFNLTRPTGNPYTGIFIERIYMCSYSSLALQVAGGGWYLWWEPTVSGVHIPIIGVPANGTIDLRPEDIDHMGIQNRVVQSPDGDLGIRYQPTGTAGVGDRCTVIVSVRLG